MSSRQWRVIFGATAAVCTFLLLQPPVQAIPVLAIVIGAVNVAVAYIKAPPDLEDPAA
jgi:uncharacterized membrane protein HdeD (DUF308 family)